MSLQGQFGKALAWMAFGNWTEQAINFVVFVLLARLLGAEAFGLLVMASALIIISEALVRESLSEYLISAEAPDDRHLGAAFWLLTALGIGLAIVLAGLAWPLAAFYDQPVVRDLLLAMVLIVPVTAVTAVPVAILRRDMEFRVLSLRAIAGVAVGGIVGIGMALAGAGVWALVGQRLALVLVNAVLAWGAVSWRPRIGIDRGAMAEVGAMGVSVVVLRAGELALTQVPLIIVGYVLGPVSAGLYSISWRLVEISSFLVAIPIRQAAHPALAAMTRAGERAVDFLIDILRITGFVAIPAFAGLSAVSLPFLAVVFGEKWLDAAPILAAMGMLGAYLSVERQLQAYVLARGRVFGLMVLVWVEVALITLALFVLLPFGLPVATAGVVCVLALAMPFRLGLTARIGGIGWFDLARPLIKPLLASGVMVAGVVFAVGQVGHASAVLGLAAGALCGLLIYGILTAVAMRSRLALARKFFEMMREPRVQRSVELGSVE